MSLRAGPAAAGEPFQESWKVAAPDAQPLKVIHDRVIIKNKAALAAYSLDTGALLWRKALPRARFGKGKISVGDHFIYLLTRQGLHLYDPLNGRKVRFVKISRPSSLLFRTASIYVSGQAGITRMDESAQKRLGRAKKVRGTIRGADGQYVAVYVEQPEARSRKSKARRPSKKIIKRLEVLDLNSGKRTYTFKLLPSGDHQVLSMGHKRLVFLDYSRIDDEGNNSQKLYYTKADYVLSKKLQDLSFSHMYLAPRSDIFQATAGPGQQVFIVNHGVPGTPSWLMAHDLGRDKTLWTRKGVVASTGVLHHGQRLWTSATKKDWSSRLVVYDAKDGSTVYSQPLDAPAVGTPMGKDKRVLVQTDKTIYCFQPAAPKPVTTAAPKPVTTATPTPAPETAQWWTHTDRLSGFTLGLPRTWQLDQQRVMKLGGVRSVIPFARLKKGTGSKGYLGSVQVLTYEAAGRTAEALWRSVLAQRKSLSPGVRVISLSRVYDIGGSGLSGIRALYRFRAKQGYWVRLTSLCVISHGVAFELRGWAGSLRPKKIWREINGIFARFKPQQF